MLNLENIKSYALPVASFGVMASAAVASTITPNVPISLILGTLGVAAGACGCWNSLKDSERNIKSLSFSALYGLTAALGVYQIYMGCKQHIEYDELLVAEKAKYEAALTAGNLRFEAQHEAAKTKYETELNAVKTKYEEELKATITKVEAEREVAKRVSLFEKSEEAKPEVEKVITEVGPETINVLNEAEHEVAPNNLKAKRWEFLASAVEILYQTARTAEITQCSLPAFRVKWSEEWDKDYQELCGEVNNINDDAIQNIKKVCVDIDKIVSNLNTENCFTRRLKIVLAL